METLAIDPGKVTQITVVDDKTGILLDTVKYNFDYSYPPEQIPLMHQKDFDYIVNNFKNHYPGIKTALYEVPYSISKKGKPYLYLRSNNQFSLLKLNSVVTCIRQALQENDFEDIYNIPASYWLEGRETFLHKKQCCMDLIDFNEYKVSKTNDHLIDTVLMAYRFNHGPILKQRVIEFNNMRFDR